MKELLQAHRVNLATSQNLRFARTTLYSTILLPPHSHLLAGTQSTLFQYWSSEPTACFGVFRVVNFIHTHTHRASLVEYQQSLQVSTVRVFTDFTRVICIILSLTLTHSLSFSQESIESLEKELQTLRERTSRGVGGGGGEGELQTPHQLNIPPITLPVSWTHPPTHPPHTHHHTKYYSPPVSVSGAAATISTEGTVFS